MIIALFIAAMIIAGQSTAPCDDECFKDKVGKEFKKESKANPDNNSWRYPKTYRGRRHEQLYY